MAELAGLTFGTLPLITQATKVFSTLSKMKNGPTFEDIVLHVLMLQDCVIVLRTIRDDEMTEAMKTATAEIVKVGMKLIERQSHLKQSRVKYVAAIASQQFEDARLKFKESVTVLQSLTQSLQLRRLLAERDARQLDLQMTKAAPGYDDHKSLNLKGQSEPHDDRYSVFSQRTFNTATAGSIADVVSLADEIATRAVRNGTYFGNDLSIETGTVVILPKHQPKERPRHVPIVAKYDTGADGNFISIDFLRQHHLEDRLVEIQEDGSVETIFVGLDGHEYHITHTITLHWCSATMNKIRHTLFHVAEEVPYDLLLGNGFIMENRILDPQHQITEESRRKSEHQKAAADEVLRARLEDKRKRALEKETRKLLKEQTSMSAMITPATHSSTGSVNFVD
ncbi:hypothetical protein E8E13_002947 [Curvularia kusanoi]|uniref:Uncharacterized protein n=1 Tax=Curvularia kusanoi TaxID=90978 RepID=A0A9P4TIA8_CURKU|nr:hypothetical protein E8E13_002947 [Curvularia kusanoi]